MADFDWIGDKSAIVIKRTDATAVYINPDNDIVIRQENLMEEDNVIIIPRSSVRAIISALESALNEVVDTEPQTVSQAA